MTGGVLAAVLASAVLHGAWNAIAKAVPERLVSSALIGLAYLVAGVVGCLVLPLPSPAAWPYLIVSALVQTLYLILLTAAYAAAEFGRVYPLTRGVAVPGVTTVSIVVLGERLTGLQLAGVAAVGAALVALALVGGTRTGLRGILLAVAVGLTVAAYSIIDGLGVRLADGALGYASWLFLLQGVAVPVCCLLLARRRRDLLRGIRRHAGIGMLGGALSLTAYAIVVWAQSVAPLSLVSALRETGVLAAGPIGYLAFRERPTPWRMTATAVAVAGIVAIKAGA